MDATPSRASDDDLGGGRAVSPVMNMGWVPPKVIARSTCAASPGIAAEEMAVGLEQGDEAVDVAEARFRGSGGPCRSWVSVATRPMSCEDRAIVRAWISSTARPRRSSSGRVRSMASMASMIGPGSNASSTAAHTTESLSGKTRKMVPSAIPDASAIWRVVTL